MTRLINKTVEKAIEEKYGWQVKLHYNAPHGYYYFYSDIDEQDIDLHRLVEGTSVLVYRLNHLTLDQWVSAFAALFWNQDEVQLYINGKTA